MKQLVIISGKGGTGKTSIALAFASLAQNKVMVDCDVDAADMHLIMSPEIIHREDFIGGKIAYINQKGCSSCGKCYDVCRFDAVIKNSIENAFRYEIDPYHCEGCGVCAWFCPEKTISMHDAVNGEWFISKTRFGYFVHARLGIAQENSGKLVTKLKTEAVHIARKENLELIIIDGSPGIGCPVIASITGASHVLVVTEPSMSARHDLMRVLELADHFGIDASVCINKYDINPEISNEIENYIREIGVTFAGKVRYDNSITHAQLDKLNAIEYANSDVADDIKSLWDKVQILINSQKPSEV